MALIAALVAGLACSGDLVTPPETGEPLPGRPPAGGGSGSGSSTAAALVGTWTVTFVTRFPSDLETSVTTWTFDADGQCARTIETELLSEGIPRTTSRDCTYQISGTNILIRFTGDAVDTTFSVSFAGFSPDRLVLGGIEFSRVDA